MRLFRSGKPAFLAVLVVCAALLSGAARSLFGDCGPFTDVSDSAFCPFVLELFTLGITTGTTPTTYAPADNVTRLQMAAFLSRTADGVLKRGSRRAALNQFWTPQGGTGMGFTSLPFVSGLVVSDGADVWVPSGNGVSRVRGSDGRLLETWTGVPSAQMAIAATGKIFVTSFNTPGRLFRIDPTQAAGAATLVASNLGQNPLGIAFDGLRFWVADSGAGVTGGDVSIVTPGPSIPFAVTIVTSGFTSPDGVAYDGSSIWVTERVPPALFKLDGSGAILQTVTVGTNPQSPLFDGTNIWVPNRDANSVSVVRASTGAVLATLTGNGLNTPQVAAFDGERVLVTNFNGNTVSLWKAANLSPIGVVSTGAASQPYGACSDGVNFWIGLFGASQLARF